MRVVKLTEAESGQEAFINIQNVFLIRQAPTYTLVAAAGGGALKVKEKAEEIASKLTRMGLTCPEFEDIDRKVKAFVVVENTFVVRWSDGHKATHLISNANGFIGVAGTVETALEKMGVKQ